MNKNVDIIVPYCVCVRTNQRKSCWKLKYMKVSMPYMWKYTRAVRGVNMQLCIKKMHNFLDKIIETHIWQPCPALTSKTPWIQFSEKAFLTKKPEEKKKNENPPKQSETFDQTACARSGNFSTIDPLLKQSASDGINGIRNTLTLASLTSRTRSTKGMRSWMAREAAAMWRPYHPDFLFLAAFATALPICLAILAVAILPAQFQKTS